MLKLVLNSFILLTLLTLGTYSDVMFEMEYKQKNTDKVDKTNAYIKDNLLKMDFLEGGDSPNASVIFRSDKEEMITLDHKEKSYFIMDKETMDKFSHEMNSAMAQMEEIMKDMTPEEKEMMNNMMKGRMPSIMEHSIYIEPVLKKAGSDKINGYSCIKYDVYKSKEKTRQYCVTDWSNIYGSEEIKSTMTKMSDFMEEFRKSFSSSTDMFDASLEFERNIFLQMRKLNGFPVQTIDYEDGTVSAVSTFISSKGTSVDMNTFEPPDNYKKQNIDMKK